MQKHDVRQMPGEKQSGHMLFCIIALMLPFSLAAEGIQEKPTMSAPDGGIAGPSLGKNWAVPVLGMDLVYIAAGSFQMGSNDGAPDETPIHSVTISKGYWMGKYELTQQQYRSIIGINPSSFPGDNRPVDTVNWNDSVLFCRALTEQEGQAGRLPEGYEYRLPTEAEWEYAARAGAHRGSTDYAGSAKIDEVAWYKENSGMQTQPVGQKPANALGLYDMSGNVYEWCLDWKGAYQSESQTDPVGSSVGQRRVRRGGGWFGFASACRVTARHFYAPTVTGSFVGLRVALAPAIKAEQVSGVIKRIDNITAKASSSHPKMGPLNTIGAVGLNDMDQHSTQATEMWLSDMGDRSVWIQYEFDRAYRLHEMKVWNSNQLVESFIGLGAKEVSIKTSIDGKDWVQLLQVPQFAQATGKQDYTANTTVEFNGTMARYVEISISKGWGMIPQYGLSEVRFFCISD